MRCAPRARTFLTLVASLALASSAAWAGKAHEHGAVKLDVAIDGAVLTVLMEAPLDNLLGFERAPRSEAERKAAAEVLARLRNPGALLAPDAAAQCTLSKAEVQAPVLEPSPGAKPAQDAHADLDASYTFNCARPAELRTLQLGLFDGYKRIQRIDVQVAGPQGQPRVSLQRPARSVKLVR